MRKKSRTVQNLQKKVEKEIKNHPKWCSPKCRRFLPEAYREARIKNRYGKKTVQGDYDLCHMFR